MAGISALEAAEQSANAVSQLASRFMLDGATYAKGAELGFNGMDFYAAGRCGVLGDVDADVVQAGLVFFAPAVVQGAWNGSKGVLPRADAAAAFAGCAHAWALAHLPESFAADGKAARLAELAGKVVAAADPALAPVFAGWRALPAPAGADPRSLAVHQMNAMRELRFARHATAVVASGISAKDAVCHRSPHMVPIFGWAGETAADGVAEQWDGAEALTNRLHAADFEALTPDERAEFVALADEAEALSR